MLTDSPPAALFQTKDDAAQAQIDKFINMAKDMMGQIPGLLSVETGKAMEITKRFNQGYEWGLVLTFEGPEVIGPYLEHPAHTPYVFLALSPEGAVGTDTRRDQTLSTLREGFQG